MPRPNRPAPKPPPSEGTPPPQHPPPSKNDQLGLYPPKGMAPAPPRKPPQRPPPARPSGGGRKRRPSTRFLDAGKAWRAHLAEYRKAHPNMSLKQQMKGAKKTYKKSKTQPISVRNTRYSVQVRPRTRKASKRTKRPKKRTGKKKRGFFGF